MRALCVRVFLLSALTGMLSGCSILFLDSAPAPEQWEGPEAKYAHCDDRALWPTLDGLQVLTSIGAAVMANDASSGKSLLSPTTQFLMWLQVWSTPQSRPTDMVSSMNARPSGNIKRCSENKRVTKALFLRLLSSRRQPGQAAISRFFNEIDQVDRFALRKTNPVS